MVTRLHPAGPNRRTAGLVAGAAVAFLALAAAVIGHAGPLLSADAAISAGARSLALAHPAWRATMAAVTVTGTWVVVVPLLAGGAAALLATGRGRAALFVVVAFPLTYGVRLLLVDAIARPRPADRLAAAAGWSFPSGHSTSAAAAGLIVIIAGWPLLHRRWSRAALVTVAAGWAVAVGVSRVALVVHWPSDVLGAWLLTLTVVPAVAMAVKATAGTP